MKSFFSTSVSWSHSFSRSFGQGVSLESCGITPSRFWLAKIWSRTAFQPLSNRCMSLILLTHSGVGWCGVRAAGTVVNQERHIRINVVDLIHPVDRVIRHRGNQVPLRVPDEGLDMRGISEQRARRPLVGVAAHEPVEVLEPHAGRPLVERTCRARLIDWRVVILAVPRCFVTVLEEDAANRGAIAADHAVVAGEAGRNLGDHTEADRVMVAPGDQ